MKYLASDKRKAEKPNFSVWNAMLLSFYSASLYVDVVKRWKGFGAKYLLLLISILVLPYSMNMIVEGNLLLEEAMFLPIKKLPPFTVHDGVVQFYSPMPYLVKNDAGHVMSIIDTTGEVNHLPDMRYPMATVLVTKDEMHLNYQWLDVLAQADLSNKKETILPLNYAGTHGLVGEELLKELHVAWIKRFFLFTLFPSIVMLFFTFYFTLLASFAIVAQFIASFVFKYKLSFKEASRLLCVAITPQTLLFFTALTFDQSFDVLRVVSFILFILYFCFGVLACRNQSKVMALS